MSDTDDEPFDKEAEKERLRQQLAEEEADREATQRMSELLLQGATMTNHHCDECGDPLFRHEGREFCPTCGRQRAGAGSSAGQDDAAAATGDGGTTADTGQPAEGQGPTGPSGVSAASSEQPPTSGRPQAGPPQAAAAEYTGEADLPGAREALARKVTALAREAEATADVGRSRELLAAVREGAEALRALEGTGR